MAVKSAVNLLNKKSTFDQGIQTLLDHVATQAAARAACNRAGGIVQPLQEEQNELMQALARAMILLKTRYSSTAYWKRTLDLVHACRRLAIQPSHQHTLATYANDIQAFLADTDPDAPELVYAAAAQPQPFLFEGQLSDEPDHARAGPGALYHLEQQLLQVRVCHHQHWHVLEKHGGV